MSLKNLNDIIEKYEKLRKQVDSPESWRMYGPMQTHNDLLIVDEFIKDLKEVKGGEMDG